ncbi:MAG TPA: chemotaxis response regulator protein-glutamate methylesterase [Lentisphaeria bacterium]|nr:MAG: chemotaxis response regulator protein-glutamate methylesterase [Lentisphaerae bacterium GWF2_50_93]HCE44684.1 chemotaxis response regulator protein-glutamate methylesterase [Lentisphaeria bacterium]
MRIAIVNDMKMAVEILRRIVSSQSPRHEVAWVAYDGREAVEKCIKDTPDLILMDLIMPVMDGAESTRRIMAAAPCGILVVTASVKGNSSKVFEAMSCGALDAVNTPAIGTDGNMSGAEQLLRKINQLEILCRNPASGTIHLKKTFTADPGISSATPYLVAVGASTGGPAALAKLVAELPAGFGAAMVIIQHIDKEFSAGLATWLSSFSKVKVNIAVAGESPVPNNIYLAETNDHLTINSSLRFIYTEDPLELPYRPSVDVFFESVYRNWPRNGSAVVLTGIGRDGAQGILALKKKGWRTMAQNKESCVVYGMPKAVAELGAADMILPPEMIGRELGKIRGNIT